MSEQVNAYKYACEFSSDMILAKSYKEFYDHAIANYQNFISVVQDAVDQTTVLTDSEGLANKLIHDQDDDRFHDNALVFINEGWLYLKDLLKGVISGTKSSLIDIDNDLSTKLDYDVHLIMQQSSDRIMKISDLFDQFNSTLHATCVERAVGLAYTAGKTISERVSLARDAIASMFSSAFSDFSNCLNDAIEQLKNGTGIMDYINRRLKRSGITQMAEFETPITESDDVEYSGASVWGSVTWQETGNWLWDGIVNAGKAVAAGAVWLFNTVRDVAHYVANKAFGWTLHTFINPIDIQVINDQGNNTMALFAMEDALTTQWNFIDSPLARKLAQGPIQMDFLPCEIIVQMNADLYNQCHEMWKTVTGRIKAAVLYKSGGTWDDSKSINENLEGHGAPFTNTICKNLEYIFNDSEFAPGQSIMDYIEENSWMMELPDDLFTIYVKIKPLNSTYLQELISGNDASCTKAIELLESMRVKGDAYIQGPDWDDWVVTDDMTEEHNMYMDWICGVVFTKALINILDHEAAGMSQSYSFIDLNGLKTAINNLWSVGYAYWPFNVDFVKLVVDGTITQGGSPVFDTGLKQDLYRLENCLQNIFTQQEENPLNMVFFPYVHNEVYWYEPSYQIVSDIVHQTELGQFIAKAITVIIAVVITVAIVKKVRKTAVKANLQAEGALWAATEAASKGQLTDDLIKNYRKAALKAKVISFLTGNMLASSGKAATSLVQTVGQSLSTTEGYISDITGNTDSGVQIIKKLIVGNRS